LVKNSLGDKLVGRVLRHYTLFHSPLSQWSLPDLSLHTPRKEKKNKNSATPIEFVRIYEKEKGPCIIDALNYNIKKKR